jgi:hypothetical protein
MVLTCKDKNQLISIQAYHHNLIKYKKTDTFFIKNNVNNVNNVTEIINENNSESINENNNESINEIKNNDNYESKEIFINNKNIYKNKN